SMRPDPDVDPRASGSGNGRNSGAASLCGRARRHVRDHIVANCAAADVSSTSRCRQAFVVGIFHGGDVGLPRRTDPMNARAAVEQSMSVRVRAIAPGAALALVIGAAALWLQRFVPSRLALPDVLVALLLGSLVINSPVSKWLRIGVNDRGRNRYGVGLA